MRSRASSRSGPRRSEGSTPRRSRRRCNLPTDVLRSPSLAGPHRSDRRGRSESGPARTTEVEHDVPRSRAAAVLVHHGPVRSADHWHRVQATTASSSDSGPGGVGSEHRHPGGRLRSGSKRGAYLDGALLRFEEPAAAEAILLRAGATSAGDLTAWFERYRTVVSDPRQRAEIVRRQGMITWFNRSVYPLLALPILMGILSKRGSYSFVVGAAVAAITVIAITRVAVHRMSEPRP